MGKSHWGKRLLGGYAGVTHTKNQILSQIPNIEKYKLWVEPFSGLGRTAETIKIPMVLNDMSVYANDYCKENFPNAIIEHDDFMNIINKYDNNDVFMMIDPPWRKNCYSENSLSFCDRSVFDYYKQLLERVETLKCDWFILSSADEHEQRGILGKSKWGTRIVQSEEKAIFGKYARTLICSNLFEKVN